MNPSLLSLPLLALSLLCAPSAQPAPQQAVAPAPAAPAEQAAPTPDTSPPIVPASELKLVYYPVRVARPRDLLHAIDGLARREFYVRNADGSVSGPVSNVRGFGDSDTLLIYDRADRIEQITSLLAALEQAAKDDLELVEPDPVLQVVEYSPRHVSVNSLFDAMRPLLRTIRVHDSGDVENVTRVDVPARLVLRDTTENVQQLLGLIERIDVPAPQLVVYCWLIHGVDQESSEEIPRELVDNLRRLVPFEGFERTSMALLRTSIVAGQEQELNGEFQSLSGDRAERFELKLVPAGYDPRTQLLTLARCAFESTTGQQFSTAAVVKMGEYVVLGAAGSDPLFVVLRVAPVEG